MTVTEAELYDYYKTSVLSIFPNPSPPLLPTIDENPDCVNLIGIRGWIGGKDISNSHCDEYNDTIVLMWKDSGGGKHAIEYIASLDPSKSSKENKHLKNECHYFELVGDRSSHALPDGMKLKSIGKLLGYRDNDRKRTVNEYPGGSNQSDISISDVSIIPGSDYTTHREV